MFRKWTLGVCILFAASPLFAANKEQERLENSGTVMQEVLDVPDDIPQESPGQGRMHHRFSVRSQGGICCRRQLRPRRDGLPHGRAF